MCECYLPPGIRIEQSQQAAVASAPIELMKGATKLAQIDLHMIMGMCGNKWINNASQQERIVQKQD